MRGAGWQGAAVLAAGFWLLQRVCLLVDDFVWAWDRDLDGGRNGPDGPNDLHPACVAAVEALGTLLPGTTLKPYGGSPRRPARQVGARRGLRVRWIAQSPE